MQEEVRQEEEKEAIQLGQRRESYAKTEQQQ